MTVKMVTEASLQYDQGEEAGLRVGFEDGCYFDIYSDEDFAINAQGSVVIFRCGHGYQTGVIVPDCKCPSCESGEICEDECG